LSGSIDSLRESGLPAAGPICPLGLESTQP
jgi:hypothetical protein